MGSLFLVCRCVFLFWLLIVDWMFVGGKYWGWEGWLELGLNVGVGV